MLNSLKKAFEEANEDNRVDVKEFFNTLEKIKGGEIFSQINQDLLKPEPPRDQNDLPNAEKVNDSKRD